LGIDNQPVGQPIIINNSLFITANIDGEGPDIVEAFDTKSGEKQWSSAEVNSFSGYYGNYVAGPEGFIYAFNGDEVYALNGDDGSVEWETQTRVNPRNATIRGNRIYIGYDSDEGYDSDGNPAAISALQLDDGSKQWTYEFSGYGNSDVVISTPAVTENRVYAGVGIFAEEGELYWRT
jgi:outer membrane protein assembly factor BamB